MQIDYKNTVQKMVNNYSDSDYVYSVFTEETILQFYHASSEEVRMPRWDYAEAVMSKPEARLRDFGLGFYTCPDEVYPLKLASANM